MDYTSYGNKFKIKHFDQQLKMMCLFSSYYPQENKLSSSQKNGLEEIFENAKATYALLEPLKNSGLNFSLSLVGGAVRDIVVDKAETINDYDFLLKLDGAYSLEQKINTKGIEGLTDFFSSSEIFEVQKSLNEHLLALEKKKDESKNNPNFDIYVDYEYEKTQAKTKVVWLKLVEKQLQTAQKNYKLFKNKDVEDKYLNKHIDGIFQINGKNEKKIDLILSSNSGMGFISTFDFEICKAEIDFKFLGEKEDTYNPTSKMLDNLWLVPGMLRDIDEKTLSIRANNFNAEHVHYFMNKHYLKLQEKFPDHKFNYFYASTTDKGNELPEKDDVMKVLEYYRLHYEISPKYNEATKKLKV